MEITSEMITAYIGGQVEIQNLQEKYLFRGKIVGATVENNEIKVTFDWLAKGEGYPPLPEKWVKVDVRDYVASLEIYSLVDIGEERLCLNSSITGETVVFYPLGGSELDASKVEGLA